MPLAAYIAQSGLAGVNDLNRFEIDRKTIALECWLFSPSPRCLHLFHVKSIYHELNLQQSYRFRPLKHHGSRLAEGPSSQDGLANMCARAHANSQEPMRCLQLLTMTTLIVPWLRVTKVSSKCQTTGQAWQKAWKSNLLPCTPRYACRLLARLQRSFKPTQNSGYLLAQLIWINL